MLRHKPPIFAAVLAYRPSPIHEDAEPLRANRRQESCHSVLVSCCRARQYSVEADPSARVNVCARQ